jgi:hypothetical protein
MKKQISMALAAAVLVAGATAATAATSSMSSMKANDSLSLSSSQQKTAWRDLNTPALNQKGPTGFDATVGAVVPNTVTTAPVPNKAASDVPALKPYNFAMLQ